MAEWHEESSSNYNLEVGQGLNAGTGRKIHEFGIYYCGMPHPEIFSLQKRESWAFEGVRTEMDIQLYYPKDKEVIDFRTGKRKLTLLIEEVTSDHISLKALEKKLR